jgi:hypothetical protein
VGEWRKAIAGQKIVSGQASEPVQQPAPFATKGFCGERGRFVAAVRFAEQSVPNSAKEEKVSGGDEPVGRRDAAQDQVGVFGIDRKVEASSLDGGVDRLNGNLGRGQVRADQDVEVRNLAELRFHDLAPHLNDSSWRSDSQSHEDGRLVGVPTTPGNPQVA